MQWRQRSAGQRRPGGRGGPGGPTQVGFVVVQQGSAPIQQELPGRVAAYQVSDVRPQVSGVILKRLFREGSVVRQGQTLYQIDPSIYPRRQAQAAGQSAERPGERRRGPDARRSATRRWRRWRRSPSRIIPTPLAQARQADAAVAQNSAALRAAQINLRFTRVPAPISGRIGLSIVTEGALVTANQADPLATITRLDPIYVDIQQSAADLLDAAPGAGAGRRGADQRAGPAEAPRRQRSTASPARSSSAKSSSTRAPAR